MLDTKTWSYTDTVWKDLLTDFNGEAITYDAIGNPTKIGTKTLKWNGRQLAEYANGNDKITYAYNGDGQRISKTVNGTKTEYYYSGSILAGQKTGSNTLIFMYDNNGDAFGFNYNGTEYFYVKNLQNDITAITDSAGKVIANYYYDAWGNITEITGNTDIANVNPLRYRSYYYDTETNLYYLSTRYYTPDMCRFLNADGQLNEQDGLLGYNMFAYCNNNPTNMSDSEGNMPFFAVTGIIGAVAGAVVGGVVAAKSGKNVWVGIGIGALAGGLIGMGAGAIASVLLTGAAASSTAAVVTGAKVLAATLSTGGIYAATNYVKNNASTALKNTTQTIQNFTGKSKITSQVKNDIIDLPRKGSAIKSDVYHAFPDIIDNYAGYATKTPIHNGMLYQIQGSFNGIYGRFEWIVQDGYVTHRMFVEGGEINGIPIMP